MYIKNQLNSKQIKLYLKRITTLIKRSKIRRLTKEEDQVTFVNSY